MALKAVSNSGGGGGGSGTVTSVSIVTANGFAGTVATATTTPAITLTTSVTGILSGNGTAISAAATTGSGSVVLATSPTLVTPVLGVASATSINKITITAPATGATLTLVEGSSLITSGAFATTLTATATTNVTLPDSGTLYGTKSGSITSAQLATSLTDETGSGANVFATSPTLVTPILGVAAATTINKVTLTAPASGSTLTIADGKVFTVSNTITLTGTDSVSANVSNLKINTVGFSGTSPVTGQQGAYVVVPYSGTITAWNIIVDAGTATVKVWKIATGTAAPTIANVINTNGVAISTGTAIRSTTLSDFTTTTVTANDIFAFDLTAVATATKIDFQLEITRT